jgi:hypothetical protein
MNQIAALFFNQTSYYLRLHKNAAATTKTNNFLKMDKTKAVFNIQPCIF